MPILTYDRSAITIGPSILAANFGEFATATRALADAGALALHIDVMDGHFVPNLTFGPQLVKDLRPVSEMFYDVHLMVESPEHYFDELGKFGAQMATIHPEATYHLDRAVNEIKKAGMEAGVALNPGTPIEACEWVLGSLDRVLVMTVNPGFGGQSFIAGMTEKIARLAEIRKAKGYSYEIAVDGGMTTTTAPIVAKHGATYLVAGSSLFANHAGPGAGFKELQTVADAD